MTDKRPRRAPAVRPDQILDAATELLVERGLPALTMDELARRAALAKGTTYLYFSSKTDVLAALRVRFVRRMLDHCDGGIEDFVDTVFTWTVENARLLAILFHQAEGDDGIEIGMTAEWLLDAVRRGIGRGEMAVADPETTVAFLVHGMHGAFAAGLHGPENDRPRVLAEVKRIFRTLLPPAQGRR